MSFRLIDALHMKAIPVAQSCRVLSVSRSGFYEAKRRVQCHAMGDTSRFVYRKAQVQAPPSP
jgi:hypothetical protein